MPNPGDYPSPNDTAGPNRRTRTYRPQSSFEHLRPYISQEIMRGAPHLSIIAAIEEQGHEIDIHVFKRLLRDWGLSNRNLRIENRKWIYEKENEALEKGVKIEKWWFHDTMRLVRGSQIEAIMRSDPARFEHVEASRGHLRFSLSLDDAYVMGGSSQDPGFDESRDADFEPYIDPSLYGPSYNPGEASGYSGLETNATNWNILHQSDAGTFFQRYEDVTMNAYTPESTIDPRMVFRNQNQDNYVVSPYYQSDGHFGAMYNTASGSGNPDFEYGFFSDEPFARPSARQPNF
ncbi:hypothetical protein AA313_de0205080 [Arthrobotrys entomopaga]|nr:hypothetical protein AA313_de0205080 [Arthrobotrys entomopaga]